MDKVFDLGVNRKNTNSIKWDAYKQAFNTECEDIIPMWVADMDFPPCEVMKEAIDAKFKCGNFGYSIFTSYYDSIVNWMDKRFNWEVKKETIVYTPGVVTAINFLLKILTNKGDKVLVQSPVYHVFYKVIENNKCTIVENELNLNQDNKYEIDFKDFEGKISQGVKVFVLCSPHNPIGRVWTEDELRRMISICKKYDVYIISDEIHADLVFSGKKHTPLAKVAEDYLDNIVICTSTSKSFNMAGLYMSNIFIFNEDLRKKYEDLFSVQPNLLGAEILTAVYNLGEPWLNDVNTYIEDNYKFIVNYIEKNIPQLSVTKQDGTFLTWLDCRALKMEDEDLNKFFLEKCRIGLNEGRTFGTGGSGFMRMNIGCPKAYIQEALTRIEKALS